MRLAFFGTAGFALPILDRLLASDHEVVGVVTGPDKPVGRGRKLTPTVIKQRALDEGLPVLTPERLKDQDFLDDYAEWEPEVAVVVAFRILPREVFDLPRHGTLNVHPSLLPKYRGPAPLNWAIIKGERETGVSIIRISEKVDGGGVVLQDRFPLDPTITAGELSEKASKLGADLIVEALEGLEESRLKPIPQDEAMVTKAPKLSRDDGKIDWTQSAHDIHNLVRGLHPWPGAFTTLRGKTIKLFDSHVINEWSKGRPGQVIKVDEEGLYVVTGDGIIVFRELQLEGKRQMGAHDLARGLDQLKRGRLGD
ncbi:methionyl-tRNA formyltransferase [bacterium]|nr:methionyl-tRNA formyltransferase [bacterium]